MAAGIVVVVVAAVVAAMPDASLIPSANPALAPVGAAAVVAAEAEVVVAAPRGLSIKDRPPAAAGVAAEVLGAKLEAAPNVKPVLAAVVEADAAADADAAKRDGPEAVDAGGAGVVEGLIPKASPPP